MSDRPIQVGDLVMVVRNGARYCDCKIAPPAHTLRLGVVFRVGKIWPSTSCMFCNTPIPQAAAQPDDGRWEVSALVRLKRLDPDALNESIPTKEELPA